MRNGVSFEWSITVQSSDIIIGTFDQPAREATGTAAIIDVFRAFTTAAVALQNGAEKIVADLAARYSDDLEELPEPWQAG